jgi:nitrogen fixation protein NifU and related proteins
MAFTAESNQEYWKEIHMYTEMAMKHFSDPQNVGTIENPDGLGKAGDPGCGDSVEFYMKIDDNIVSDVKYKVFGCAGSIATSSMTSILAKGKTIFECMEMTEEDIVVALGGLPEDKVHCSNLGIRALGLAIKNYYDKRAGIA